MTDDLVILQVNGIQGLEEVCDETVTTLLLTALAISCRVLSAGSTH